MLRFVAVLIASALLLVLPSFALAAKTHVVKKNETLSSLSRKYHVSVAELKSVNNILGSQVKSGTKLIIPVNHVVKSQHSGLAATHKVKKKETLASISRKTGVSVFELKRLNGLTKNSLKTGQLLALRDTRSPDDTDAPSVKSPSRLSLRHPELFNDKDYEASLAELVDQEVAPEIDLKKSAELNPENMKLLRKAAYGFLGTRYRFGGTTRKGLDCSSFVQQVFREMEVALPRTAREQFQIGNRVPSGTLQKGDLIFFRTYASFPSHVGIYLGNNRMIHASSRDRSVVISSLNTPYYRSRYIGAKRIDKINPDDLKLEELIASAEEELLGDEEENDSMGVSSDVSSSIIP